MAKKTIKERVIDYFKKKGTYNKYQKDGSLKRRIKKGVEMAKAKEQEDDSDLVGTMDDLYNEVIIPGITNKLNPAKRQKVIKLLNENREKQGLPSLVQSPHKETGQRELLSKAQADKKKAKGKRLDTIGHMLGGATDFLADKFSAVDFQFIKENPELGIRGIDERFPGRPKNIVHADLLGQKMDPIEQSYLDYVGYKKDRYEKKGGTVLEETKQKVYPFKTIYPVSNKDYKEEARKAIEEKKTKEFLQPDVKEKSKRLQNRETKLPVEKTKMDPKWNHQVLSILNRGLS